MCGDREVDLVYFFQLVQEQGFKTAFLTEDRPKGPQILAKRSSQDMTHNEEFKHPKQLSGQSFIEILTSWYVYKQQAETSGLNLMDLTLLTHGFKASVQRDKIFALLGLATPEARSCIIPDYSDTMSDRFFLTRITAYFLQFSSQPLRIASHCSATDCPSWVPDWTAIDSKLMEAMKNDVREDYNHDTSQLDERLPSRDSLKAIFNPRLEPPFQELKSYQEPSALLVNGSISDQVQTAIQIPCALDATGHYSSAAAPSIKAKLREWESLMFKWHSLTQEIIRKRDMATELSPQEAALRNRKVKASIIKHLAGRITHQRTVFAISSVVSADIWEIDDGDRELIDVYEEWMLSPGQHVCDSCMEKNSSPYSDRLRCPLPRSPKELGLKIIALNAGKTLVLTKRRDLFISNCAVNKGDVICALRHAFPLFILRGVGDEYWTLIGHHHDEYKHYGKAQLHFKDQVITSMHRDFRLK